MNTSIQQEIAAPQDCTKNPSLLLIALFNLFAIVVCFSMLILKNNGAFDGKYLTPSLLIAIIVAIALVAAVLLRKNHTTMLTVLTLAALDAAILLTYHNIVSANNTLDVIWRVTTTILSFGVLIFCLLFLGIYFSKPRERNPAALSSTKYITYCAMFTALSVICKMLGNLVSATFGGETIKLTLVYIPWVIGGIVLGPIGGFAAAAIGDFVGQLAVSTGGMPLPLLTLSNGLFAVFPAMIYKLIQNKNTRHRAWLAISIGTLLSAILCTLGLSTFVLHDAYFSQVDFSTYFATRLIQVVVIALNIALMLPLTNPLLKAKILKQPITRFFD